MVVDFLIPILRRRHGQVRGDTGGSGARCRQICEFKVILVYIVSSRPARTILDPF